MKIIEVDDAGSVRILDALNVDAAHIGGDGLGLSLIDHMREATGTPRPGTRPVSRHR